MASQDDLSVIKDARVLVVGAGGVGCELLKTLALSGFEDIEIIDIGTIEVSDLNGQSLFRQSHVGQSKAKVARDAVLRFRPHINITAHHKDVDDIYSRFFMKFDVILSALSNLDTRRHVNRLALDADVPLIDSGTTQFKGQVTVHVKEKTECFECQLELAPKTHPVCTATSTQSEFHDCIFWALDLLTKKLFGNRSQSNYLNVCFSDATSPSENPTDIFERRKDEDIDQYGRRIYDHVFGDNIEAALLKEETLKNHNRPKPVYIRDVLSDEPTKSGVIDAASVSVMTTLGLTYPHAIWSLKENSRVFLEALKLFFCKREKEAGNLDFDKEDQLTVEFVTAAANIRAASFGIPMQSLFQTKGFYCDDGQVLPATNAIIAGLIVIEAIKVLKRDEDNYCMTFCLEDPIKQKRIVALEPFERNKSCYVCSERRVYLEINTHRVKFRDFLDRIVTGKLGVNNPMITVGVTDLYGNDEEELDNYEANLKQVLSQLSSPITTGTWLSVEDTKHYLSFDIIIKHRDDLGEKEMVFSRREGNDPPVEKDKIKFVVKGEIPSSALPIPAGDKETKKGDQLEILAGWAEAPAGNKRKPSDSNLDETRNPNKSVDIWDDDFDMLDTADSKASKKKRFR